jgi:radical SAM protein with 4Fe4S-binding SPASM domain
LKCKICHIWNKKSKDELSFKEINNFFRKNNSFNWVDLTGGEIFLRDDLFKISESVIQNCKNLCLLHFPTNGFLTKRIINETKKILDLSPYKLIITVSIDGPKKIHDNLRGVKESWARAFETYKSLKKLKRKNFEVYLGMTLSKYNLGLIDETVEEFRALIPSIHYNDFHLNIAQTSRHFYRNVGVDLGVDKEVIRVIEEFRQRKKGKFTAVQFLEGRYQQLIPQYIKTSKSPLTCQSLSASVFIDPYGNIYPCAIWDKKIVSLRDGDFNLKKIWHSNRIKEIRKKIISKQCPGCWTPCEAYQTILGNFFRSCLDLSIDWDLDSSSLLNNS